MKNVRRVVRSTLLASALVLGAVAPPPAGAIVHPPYDPLAQISDLYAFVAADAPQAVTVVATFRPGWEPAGGPLFPRFDDGVRYAIHVDNDGDCLADVSYHFSFTTSMRFPFSPLFAVGQISTLAGFGQNLEQTYAVTRFEAGDSTVLGTALPVPPTFVGPLTTPDYGALVTEATANLGGTVVFCGPRDDPHFLDFALFDLFALRPGAPGTAGGGVDARGGSNVLAICLQIPIPELTTDGMLPTGPEDPDAVLGLWATTSRREETDLSGVTPVYSGPFIQVARAGMPLVDEVLLGLGQLEAFRGSDPSTDAQFLGRFEDSELAALITSELSIATPPVPRADLPEVYLEGWPGLTQTGGPQCDLLRLNVGVPPAVVENRLGLLGGDTAGFPNGRRPADDVLDLTLRLAAGALVPGFETSSELGDGVDENDVPFLSAFPYLADPHSGYSHAHHPEYVGPPVSVPGTTAPGAGRRLLTLAQNAPNPFRGPETRIVFQLARRADVSLAFYDVRGRLLDRVAWKELREGVHSFAPRTDGWASGTYYYVLSAGDEFASRSMTLIK